MIKYLNSNNIYAEVANALLVNTNIPIDARVVADSTEDLWRAGAWDWKGTEVYYQGMLVSVVGTGEVWQLTGTNAYDSTHWSRVSSSSSDGDLTWKEVLI